eukprot:CAMPEP_0174275456 /NCGR_PEP_ID=MMETSP0439-20130205/59834_1 /TAXON_ID=0 /ORGANISM="Stereomyxa ramosa, Strain Chinc5" /LENGTH=612 /DNA_ID=CAMNT_0015367559 /DNA_START=285 /DNA_END=2123 /DNA_ORIENTATION=-
MNSLDDVTALVHLLDETNNPLSFTVPPSSPDLSTITHDHDTTINYSTSDSDFILTNENSESKNIINSQNNNEENNYTTHNNTETPTTTTFKRKRVWEKERIEEIPHKRARRQDKKEKEAMDYEMNLPTELLFHVFQFLEKSFVAKVIPCVCNQWQEVAYHPALWKDSHWNFSATNVDSEEYLCSVLKTHSHRFSLVKSISLPPFPFDHELVLGIIMSSYATVKYLELPADNQVVISDQFLNSLTELRPGKKLKGISCYQIEPPTTDETLSTTTTKSNLPEDTQKEQIVAEDETTQRNNTEGWWTEMKKMRVEMITRGEELSFIQKLSGMKHLKVLDIGGIPNIGEHFMGWRTAILRVEGGKLVWDTKGTLPFLRESPVFSDPILTAIATSFPCLQSLRLTNCGGVRGKGVVDLAENCRQLTDLQLHCCADVEEEALLLLAINCPLKTLQISLMTSLSTPKINNYLREALNSAHLDVLDLPLSEGKSSSGFYLSSINRTLAIVGLLLELEPLVKVEEEEGIESNFRSMRVRMKCLAKLYEELVYNKSTSMQDYQEMLGRKCDYLKRLSSSISSCSIQQLKNFVFLSFLHEVPKPQPDLLSFLHEVPKPQPPPV